MKTRRDERLSYLELARQGACVERSLSGNDLPRFSQLVDGEWGLRAVLKFSVDDNGLAWVKGHFEGHAGLQCLRCSEVLSHGIEGKLAMCIVASERQASELAAKRDVLLVQGDEVAVADIVEDELLLSLPRRLCDGEECERSLPLSYPAAAEGQLEDRQQAERMGQAEKTQQPERNNPFSVLARLKQVDKQ